MSDERVATNFKLTRLVRTQTSEIYLILDDDRRIGQLDLHYAHDTIHGTLILESDLSIEQEEGLIAQIDDDFRAPPVRAARAVKPVFTGRRPGS